MLVLSSASVFRFEPVAIVIGVGGCGCSYKIQMGCAFIVVSGWGLS